MINMASQKNKQYDSDLYVLMRDLFMLPIINNV